MSDIKDYDRAISAYQFQVERYHTWMNYYSLFHGALLVALYSIANEHCIYLNQYFITLICLVGFIAGLCWLGTVVGNMAWMNKWLKIIKEEEKEENICYTKSGIDIDEKEFLSTQKIMRFFVITVCIAWGVIPFFYFTCVSSLIYSIFIFTILGVALMMYINKSKYIHS